MSVAETINPVIAEIPEGAIITAIMRNGMRFTGTDDTTKAQETAGVLALYVGVVGHGRNATNRKVYLLAADVIGFEIEYD